MLTTQILRQNTIYPQDSVRCKTPSHVYEGRITTTTLKQNSPHTYPTLIRTLDHAVVVESVDEKTRLQAIQQFNSLKALTNDQKTTSAEHFYKGIGTTLLGSGIGGAAFFLASPMAIASAIVSGLGLTAFGIWRAVKSTQAISLLEADLSKCESMQAQWQDSLPAIAEQRQQAGLQGFQYVFKNQLKDSVVHLEEVRAFWMRDFIKLLSQPAHAYHIFNEDLLGQEKFAYAWQNELPAPVQINGRFFTSSMIQLIQTRYQESHKAYLHFNAAIQTDLTAMQNQYEQIKTQIRQQSRDWMRPAETLYALGLEEAEFLHRDALQQLLEEKKLAIESLNNSFHYVMSDHFDAEEMAYKRRLDTLKQQAIEQIERDFCSHPSVIAIEQAYANDRRMCEFLYIQAKLKVDAFFDARLRQLEQEVNMARQRIEMQRSDGINFFSKLLNSIFQTHSEAELHALTIASPPVVRNWCISNYAQEPSWMDVYGSIPSFQSQFAQIVSSDVWNRFWGSSGLGRYASCSFSRWGNLYRDRSYSPFKQHWFSLHTVERTCSPRMFVRPVCVPPPPRRQRSERVSRDRNRETCPNERVRPGQRPEGRRKNQEPDRHVPVKIRTSTGFSSTRRR